MKAIFKLFRIVLFMLLAAAAVTVPAQPTTPPGNTMAADDQSSVPIRRPAPGRLDDYRTDRDYQYGRDVKPISSPWDKFWDWFWQKVSEAYLSRAYQDFGQYILLAAAAALVIRLLLKADLLGTALSRSARELPLSYETLSKNIHEINFNEQINLAVEQRNYRLAVRLLYLQSLKTLTDRQLIDWKPNKTNRHYVLELTGSPLQASFEQLTTQFEYIWYGDFSVTESRFQPLRSSFQTFNRQVIP